MRRAKIVCTLGPAVASQEGIASLIEAGMDVARMNLSHGAYADHERIYEWVRTAADAAGRGVGIMVDLQGPKIRLGRFSGGPVVLDPGATFSITIDDVDGNVDICSTTYKGLPGDVSPGDAILIDDGKVALEAVEVSETTVVTRVVEGGRISDNKGINLPGVAVSVPAMSEKDVADLRWALRLGVDMIALSFVRRADDLLDVVRIMDDEGVRLPVLAKIEKPQAVDNLESIVDAFDGIMVARGDLGVELPLEQVPLVQKRAVTLARRRAKPVIVATQMLDSMVSMTRPTRAEASDVANAVLDGADALMLSGETSVGAHPAHVVRTMSRIIEQVEGEALDQLRRSSTATTRPRAPSPVPPSTWAWTSGPARSSPSRRPVVPRASSPATAPTSSCSRSRRTRGCAASSRCAGASRPSSSRRWPVLTRWCDSSTAACRRSVASRSASSSS